MSTPTALASGELYRRCDPAQFAFETTAELEILDDIIGQDRAVEAIRFGIGMRHDGFNLYALGPNGVGKHTVVKQFLHARAPHEPTPDDWCYVNNFAESHRPIALRLPAGQGNDLKRAMVQLLDVLQTVIPATLNSEEVSVLKKALIDDLKARESRALRAIEEEANTEGIGLVQTPAGFAFAPLRDGKMMSPSAFGALPAAEQQRLEARIEELQGALQDILRQIPQWHQETHHKLRKLQRETAVRAITPLINQLKARFQQVGHVVDYLESVQQDMVEHVGAFIDGESDAPPFSGGIASAGAPRRGVETRYAINVVVDNSRTNGAPIILDDQPSYQNLIGRVEHISQLGALLTDFTLIKAGALHRANGGYLVLDARQLLLQPYAWEGLKRALRAGQVQIESLGQLLSLSSTVSLAPEPIPLKVKVILTGDRLLYYLLAYHDPDFGELFKVAADFENEMARHEAHHLAYAHLIANVAEKEKLRHFERSAVARVIEESSRLAGDATKLTTHMRSISDLLREANHWAGEAGHNVVTAADVGRALEGQRYRAGRVRERLQEAILRDTILIDTSGAVIGQANGLSVVLQERHAFGRPSRITARVRLGKGEVVDIERRVELGGPIHAKGVLILAGYLGARYAAERPLSLSATLVFEQSYQGVEGDSASLAELYALLSALADLPLKQSLAITGAVNQRGQVQAVGGVNEKIEGFFDLCQARGLTGEQGVLIPAANRQHLMLRHDVVAAAEAGRFHIYPIATVDEGLELLTGAPAGVSDAAGNFPPGSVNDRIVARLVALAEKARAFAAPAGTNGAAAGVGERVV